MLGPEGVTRGLFLHAVANLPGRMGILRARYGASTADLPDFANYYPDEIGTLSIEKFPALAVVVSGTTGELGNRQTDVDATYEEYSYRYKVQLYAYAMGATGPETSQKIKRYTLAVREAFLADKILPVGDTDAATVDPRSLVESYSELDMSKDQYIAASYVQFEVVTHERLDAINPFGTDPAAVELGAGLLPQHPYFDE
jgi:hypothetical protein